MVTSILFRCKRPSTTFLCHQRNGEADRGVIQSMLTALCTSMYGKSRKERHRTGQARLVWLLPLFLLTLKSGVVHCEETNKGRRTGDPLTSVGCDPEGRLFVALGHSVVAVRDIPGVTLSIPRLEDGAPAGKQRLRAPDKTQKEGCYANPFQTPALHGMQRTFIPAGTTGFDPDEMIDPIDLTLLRQRFWQAATQSQHEWFCKPEKGTVVHKNGVELCIEKLGQQPTSGTSAPAPAPYMAYRLSQEFFPTSTGRDLNFVCGFGANLRGFNNCETALTINNDMTFMLTFYPPRKGYDDDFPRRVYVLVQAIRDAILRVSVTDYPWK